MWLWQKRSSTSILTRTAAFLSWAIIAAVIIGHHAAFAQPKLDDDPLNNACGPARGELTPMNTNLTDDGFVFSTRATTKGATVKHELLLEGCHNINDVGVEGNWILGGGLVAAAAAALFPRT